MQLLCLKVQLLNVRTVRTSTCNDENSGTFVHNSIELDNVAMLQLFKDCNL